MWAYISIFLGIVCVILAFQLRSYKRTYSCVANVENEIEELRNKFDQECTERINIVEIEIEEKRSKFDSETKEKIKNDYQQYNLLLTLHRLLYQKIHEEVYNHKLIEKYIVIKKNSLSKYDKKIKYKKNQILELRKNLKNLRNEAKSIKDEVDLYEVGFYDNKYNLEDSILYKEKLEDVRFEQKRLIGYDNACISSTQWLVNNSARKGNSMTKRQTSLMLRAFNGECDAIIATVSYKNINSMTNRLKRAYNAINKLSKMMNYEITDEYLDLKLQEIYLVYEYQEKLYQEKEEQRIIKEQIKEEEKAQREFEKSLLKAEKEAEMYKKAIKEAKKELEKTTGKKLKKLQDKIKELEFKLNEAEVNRRAISQAQITKSGYVYIISNIGSFGENVYKIGMTRRVEPSDRIRELNGASVPFKFDVHAMFFTKNAPELELKIHKKLSERRVNQVNFRKEFFNVTLQEIEKIFIDCGGKDIEFIYTHEAKEYRQSIAIQQESIFM